MDWNLIVNALIFLVFSLLKAQGKTDEEARVQFHAKVDEVKETPPLPMNTDPMADGDDDPA